MDISSILDVVTNGAGALESAVKAVNTAKDILKSKPDDQKSIGPINELLNEALEQMIQIREQRIQLLEAAMALRSEKAAFELQKSNDSIFSERSPGYVLKAIAPNSHAYVPKEEASGLTVHHACVRCFDDRVISVLQLEKRDFYFDTLICHRCSSRVRCENDNRPVIMTAPRRRNDYLNDGWDGL